MSQFIVFLYIILDAKDIWAHFYLPRSRTLLIGEQPNPWELLHPQDRAIRHRGAEHRRRCDIFVHFFK